MSMKDIQAELKAPKGQFNSFGKYRYRSCEDIVEAVKPVLAKYGFHLNLSDDIVQVGERIYVKAVATVRNGLDVVEMSTAFARESLDKKGMDDSQITGTASSYARKYALNGLFAIDDTKDADTNEHKQLEARPDKVVPPATPKPPTAEHERQFGEIASLGELVELWESLSKEDKVICAGLKNAAKANLS